MIEEIIEEEKVNKKQSSNSYTYKDDFNIPNNSSSSNAVHSSIQSLRSNTLA